LNLKAVLFDMDGVVTATAKVHAAAWQRVFDEFLEAQDGSGFRPFDPKRDYRRYVDGKPRYAGVESFLASRGIELPYGGVADPPDALTVCGLGNRKDGYFRAWLVGHRAQAFPGTVKLVRELRDAGIRVAVFSASRNAVDVLSSAQVLDLFDAKVDGGDLARLRLPGKPDPAMLREAAARLAMKPEQCAVIEDSIAGIEAAVRGGFGCAIGVNRGEHAAALRDAGAQLVVHDVAELALASSGAERRLVVKTLADLPTVWDHNAELRRRLQGRELAVFLDYDGTLTPIVEDHTRAFLAGEVREAVRALSERCKVAVVSGRDLALLRSLVQLDTVYCAGSHGFEIAGPAGRRVSLERGVEFLPEIDAVERALRTRLAGIAGHSVERKRFSVAVHFRQVAPRDVSLLEDVVDAVLAEHPHMRRGHGKMVFEIQPDIDWNKGEAVRWLLERLGADLPDVVPVYLGDDITDEHAFRALAGRGVCVAVRDGATRPTAADFALDHVADVPAFLGMLAALPGTPAKPGAQAEPAEPRGPAGAGAPDRGGSPGSTSA